MSEDFYRPIEWADVHKTNDVEPTKAVRLYCESIYHGGSWVLQVRAPQQLASGREGKAFMVASAHLDKSALLALRDAIDAEIDRRAQLEDEYCYDPRDPVFDSEGSDD